MRWMGPCALACVLACLLVAGGCSVVLVVPPPATPERPCSESSVGPILDAVVGIPLTLAGGLMALGYAERRSDSVPSYAPIVPIGIAVASVGALFDISAIVGASRQSTCSEQHRRIG